MKVRKSEEEEAGFGEANPAMMPEMECSRVSVINDLIACIIEVEFH